MKVLLLMSFLALLSLPVKALDAPSGLIPPSLEAGDQFYIVFVTSTSTAGNLPSAADYNAAVEASADLNPITGDPSITWRALFAHNTGVIQSTSLFTEDSSRPIFNRNGDLVSASSNDFFGGIGLSLSNAIAFDEAGLSAGADAVWTGLASDATSADPLGGLICNVGSRTAVNESFLSLASGLCSDSLRLYAASPLLTVPAAPTLRDLQVRLEGSVDERIVLIEVLDQAFMSDNGRYVIDIAVPANIATIDTT